MIPTSSSAIRRPHAARSIEDSRRFGGALKRASVGEPTFHELRLTPDNVRLAHLLCNRRDYGWRMKINAMLGKRMSLEEIAAHLNAQKVPPIHGTNRWTASSVRQAFVS